jgi:hypothetical protein
MRCAVTLSGRRCRMLASALTLRKLAVLLSGSQSSSSERQLLTLRVDSAHMLAGSRVMLLRSAYSV